MKRIRLKAGRIYISVESNIYDDISDHIKDITFASINFILYNTFDVFLDDMNDNIQNKFEHELEIREAQ